MDWSTAKERILEELGEYIANLSSEEPIPFELIAELTEVEARLQTTNEIEFKTEGYQEWWDDINKRLQD